jgi:vanillate/4-hydroxybenzoate decarboxylase subunit D
VTTTTCPRCRSEDAHVSATSPVPDCWTVHTCATCYYTWRSTEAPQATDPDKFPPAFSIDPASIASLPAVPSIPERRHA